jgi:DNA-binding NarL/FixJ family response regulator
MTDSPLRLMLVDEDPVFRLGLRIWLEQSAGYRVVAEANQAQDALAILTARMAPVNGEAWTELDAESLTPLPDRPPAGPPDLDLVILDLGLGAGDPSQLPGLQLCAEIKTRFPTLPVLVLSAHSEPVLEAAARQLGANGFGARSLPVADLGRLIEQTSRPQPEPLQTPPPAPTVYPRPGLAPPRPAPPGLTERPAALGPWAALRLNLRRSSVQQIDAVMAAIEAEQRRGRADLWTEAVLAGRYRELKAARWLVGQLLATPAVTATPSAPPPQRQDREPAPAPLAQTAERDLARQGGVRRDRTPENGSLEPGWDAEFTLAQGDLATLIFERVFKQLQGCLDNTSDLPLETDILRDDKKRELFYLTLRKFEDALDHLRQAGVLPGQLPEKSALVVRDVWEATLSDFFGRYYSLPVTDLEQPVVPTLMAEAEIVQRSILDRLPQVPMLLGHLLFQESMIIDGGTYRANTPEALDRSQALLENLLIQIANGVVQPLLNSFADVELIKKNLYHRRMITSRDIERFRNDLSWRYRWDGLINEPRAIFESQYRLFGFTERGIQTTSIYAPRRPELENLSGLQRVVTLTIEARDAVAPRFRSAISLVGSSVVYLLTDVVGRGIGLIGRGILRGVGNAWREPRYRDDRDRDARYGRDRSNETRED